MKKHLALLICLTVFIASSCYVAKVAYFVKKDTVGHFYVIDTPFEVAFSKAIETAIEKGMTVQTSDKDSGVFFAVYPGTAFGGEVASLNFLLTREPDSRLKCTLSIKSSKSNQAAIDEFKAAYAKKVKTSEY